MRKTRQIVSLIVDKAYGINDRNRQMGNPISFTSFILGLTVFIAPLRLCAGGEGTKINRRSEETTVHWPQFRKTFVTANIRGVELQDTKSIVQPDGHHLAEIDRTPVLDLRIGDR